MPELSVTFMDVTLITYTVWYTGRTLEIWNYPNTNHLNTEHLKSEHLTFEHFFGPVFKWFYHMIRQTILFLEHKKTFFPGFKTSIQNPDIFGAFEDQTCPVFRWLLYWTIWSSFQTFFV